MKLLLLSLFSFFALQSSPQQGMGGIHAAKNDSSHLVVKYTEGPNAKAVKIGNKWKLFNLDGTQLNQYKYDGIGEGSICGPTYAQFIIPVKLGEKWGLIDSKGNERVPCMYDEIAKSYRYKTGATQFIIPVRLEQKWGILNGHFKLITPIIYDKIAFAMESRMIRVTINNLVGVIDTLGNTIAPCNFDYVKFDSWRFIEVVKDKQMGLIKRDGEVLVPPGYDDIYHLDRSFDPEHDWFHILKDKKAGLMDSAGKVIIPCIYDAIYLKKRGNLIAKKDGKWGLISSTGQQLIAFDYDGMEEMSVIKNDTIQYYSAVLNGSHGLLNSKGAVILKFEYAGIDRDMRTKNPFNSLVKAWKTTGKGIVTLKGDIILPFIYKQIYDLPGNYIVLDHDGKSGLTDLTGMILLPCDYERISEIQGADYYVIVKNKKISIVTRKGKFILKDAFDGFETFPNFTDFILVKQDQKYGLLDRTGKLAYPCIYKRITYMNEDFVFEKF